MATVIGSTKAEFDKAEMNKRSGLSQDAKDLDLKLSKWKNQQRAEKSEKGEDKTVATMPSTSKKSIDIGEGRYLHKHGRDVNGNHAVWVSQGSETPKKIQSVQNLPTVHNTRPELTEKGINEIHDYANKYWSEK